MNPVMYMGITGLYTNDLLKGASPITIGINFDSNPTLLPGRDLRHARRGRASSTGLNLKNNQGSISPVLEDKFMDNLGTIKNRPEFKQVLSKIGLRSSFFLQRFRDLFNKFLYFISDASIMI